jgi:hypothetical protein
MLSHINFMGIHINLVVFYWELKVNERNRN